MNSQLGQRLALLKAEFQSGQKALADLQVKQADLQSTLLRISSAIRVIEEELSKANSAGSEPVTKCNRLKVSAADGKSYPQWLDAENKIKVFCENRIPEEVKDKIKMKYEIKGEKITIFEERPRWTDEGPWTKMPIAQIRYSEEKKDWTLYCIDRNEKRHKYSGINPRKRIEEIIKEIDSDPTGVF